MQGKLALKWLQNPPLPRKISFGQCTLVNHSLELPFMSLSKVAFPFQWTNKPESCPGHLSASTKVTITGNSAFPCALVLPPVKQDYYFSPHQVCCEDKRY